MLDSIIGRKRAERLLASLEKLCSMEKVFSSQLKERILTVLCIYHEIVHNLDLTLLSS